MVLPSSIIQMKFRVSTGTSPNVQTFEQLIPSATMGSNSVPIAAPEILTAFNTNPEGTSFTPSIVTRYSYQSGNVLSEVSTPSVLPNFIPKKIPPTLFLATLPSNLTTGSTFSLAELVTKSGTGVLAYSSSHPSVATVNSSGVVTLVSIGTTTITVNLSASSDGLYAAAGPVSKELVVTEASVVIGGSLTLAANGVTIKYTGSEGDIPSSTPLFIQANPRGTLLSGVPQPEWFAVVTDASKAQITAYAKNEPTGITYFTPPDQTNPVPFNNIVTTLINDMDYMFENVGTFNADISSWDTSDVKNMRFMFMLSFKFNGNLSNWDTSKVTDMDRMFSFAVSFNNYIGSWDVSKVTNMYGMFQYANIFNQNLSGWNVALTPTRPTLNRSNFADGSPLADAENSGKLPLFQ
jgi:surface protein